MPERAWHLRTRLAIALVGVFLPVSLLIVFSHLENLNERRDQRVDELKLIDRTIAASLEGFARDLETFSLSTAITLGVAASAGTEFRQDNLGPYFKDLASSYGFLRAVFLTDTNGLVVAGSGEGSAGVDLSHRDYVKALQAGADSFWSDAVAGLESGQATLVYGRPVIARGETRYFLFSAFYPYELARRLPGDLPEDANISLIGRNGVVLFTTQGYDPQAPLADVSDWGVFQRASSGQAVSVVSEPTAIEPDERYGAFIPIKHTGWIVGFTRPAGAIDAPLESRFRRDLLIIVGILGAGFAAMLYIAGRVSKPLAQLANAADAIARGEQPVLPAQTADAEVRRLQVAMMTMSEAVRQREAQLQDQAEQLRQANRSKDEFLGIIAHELRTPVTTIFGSARLLRSRAQNLPPEAVTDLLAALDEESSRLHRLIEDLLAIARTDLGREIQLQPVSLQPLVEETVKAFGRQEPDRRIDVAVPGEIAPARAEPTYLQQVLTNLLSNADKYSPPDQRISIEAREAGANIYVRVMDRGPGVPPSELEHIFDSFYRSNRTADQAPGKGLGLTVCKRLIEAMSGSIWARPREGGGLEVGFSLPAVETVRASTNHDAIDAGLAPESQRAF